MAGVVLFNPAAGSGSVDRAELERLFPGHPVEECAPDELVERVRAAAGRGVDFVAVAGGDGTIRAAAEQLVGGGTPLLPVPAGTRNHFSRDLGIGDLDAAAAAARGLLRRTIDIGRVNGRCFVNNSSIGLYPRIVVSREAREHRMRKPVANVVAVVEQLRRGRRFRVGVDGRRYWASMVFVGNGSYGDGLLDLADRESLDGNRLDLRVVRADRPAARLRVLLALLLGRLAASPLVEREQCRSVRIDLSRREVEVALDGEVERLTPPLEYESMPGALTVLVPPDDA